MDRPGLPVSTGKPDIADDPADCSLAEMPPLTELAQNDAVAIYFPVWKPIPLKISLDVLAQPQIDQFGESISGRKI